MGLDYQKMFADAKGELEQLQAAKGNLEAKLAQVSTRVDAMTKAYNAIAPLVGEQPIPTLKDALITTGIEVLKAAGITVAVRWVLDSAPTEDFTASSVRDRLGTQGWDWGDSYANALPTIHTTLVRLVESGAAKETTTSEGKKAFYSAKRVLPPRPKMEPPSTVGVHRPPPSLRRVRLVAPVAEPPDIVKK
jgi:hypothetical protein